jgi:uracil-DNA glycosylase
VIGDLQLAPGWSALVQAFFLTPEGKKLSSFVEERRAAGATIFPPQPLRALTLTPFDEVRVVILGQDPYHGEGQAHGLAFSVPQGIKTPPSLRNIFSELQRDLGCTPPIDGTLDRWARQGVLLLNAVFTVERGLPGSHARKGWETFTSMLMEALVADQRPKVFMLWGMLAQAWQSEITAPHLVLQANHPSPLSARRPPVPFVGCGHFSQANAFLQQHGRGVIDWC